MPRRRFIGVLGAAAAAVAAAPMLSRQAASAATIGTYTIAAGGTYGPNEIGASRQVDPASPQNTRTDAAVYVNTTAPVTITGVSLSSTVWGVPCVYSIPGAQVTVTNCYLSAYVRNGFCAIFDAANAPTTSITLLNNDFYGGTVAVAPSSGQGQVGKFQALYNTFRDVYGTLFSSGDPLRQALQFHNSYGPGIEVGWNTFTNDYGVSSVEDIWTFYADSGYRCGGTVASRAEIHDNLLDGSFNAPGSNSSHSGSAGGTDLYGAEIGSFCDVHDNQYVRLSNGTGPGSGQSNYWYNNRVVCSGLMPDGSVIQGLSTNANGLMAFNATNSSSGLWDGVEGHGGWGDCQVYNNVVGFMRPVTSNGTAPLHRSDTWFDNVAGVDPMANTSGNLHVAAAVNAGDPWYTGSSSSSSYAITLADEAAERTRWQAKVTAAGHTIGSGAPPPPPPQNITPRCTIRTHGTGSSWGVPLTGWANYGMGVSGTAPQPGDLVVMHGIVFSTGHAISQTGGTGAWTIHSADDDNNGGNLFESFVATRIFDGTETGPTFGLGSSSRHALTMTAYAPAAGVLTIDTWSVTKIDTSSSTSHTPNSAVAAGAGETSILLYGGPQTAKGTSLETYTAPSGWTRLADSECNDVVSGSRVLAVGDAWKTGLGSGTIAPGAVGMSPACTANMYHLLVKAS